MERKIKCYFWTKCGIFGTVTARSKYIAKEKVFNSTGIPNVNILTW